MALSLGVPHCCYNWDVKAFNETHNAVQNHWEPRAEDDALAGNLTFRRGASASELDGRAEGGKRRGMGRNRKAKAERCKRRGTGQKGEPRRKRLETGRQGGGMQVARNGAVSVATVREG